VGVKWASSHERHLLLRGTAISWLALNSGSSLGWVSGDGSIVLFRPQTAYAESYQPKEKRKDVAACDSVVTD